MTSASRYWPPIPTCVIHRFITRTSVYSTVRSSADPVDAPDEHVRGAKADRSIELWQDGPHFPFAAVRVKAKRRLSRPSRRGRSRPTGRPRYLGRTQ